MPEASIGVLVAGHGRFAGGLVEAVELILGPQEGLRAVDFTAGDTATELKDGIDAALADLAGFESVAVFCDLRGGSPFNVSRAAASSRDDVDIYYGANLPMLIDFVSKRNLGVAPRLLRSAAVDEGRSNLDCFDASAVEAHEDDWA